MSYLFIAGLEHSGSTLLGQLLAQVPRVLDLGEVAQFFSPEHMRWYMDTWGHYADARLCSCGALWDDCPVWGELAPLNGLVSEDPLAEKYTSLMDFVGSRFGAETVIVDASKNLKLLETIRQSLADSALAEGPLCVSLAVKDVRNFSGSIARKSHRHSFLSAWRTFNWWLGVNRALLGDLSGSDLPFDTVLYERLCTNPEICIGAILERFGLGVELPLDVSHTRSHIAIGNKDFATRNRERISYDTRWLLEDMVGATYLLHRQARLFNRSLYQLCLNPVHA